MSYAKRNELHFNNTNIMQLFLTTRKTIENLRKCSLLSINWTYFRIFWSIYVKRFFNFRNIICDNWLRKTKNHRGIVKPIDPTFDFENKIIKLTNTFAGPDNHIMWVLTRKSDVDWDTYKKIYEDIKNSGINPHYLMSIDQSTDLTKIPTVTPGDLNGDIVIQETSVTSSSSTTTSGGTTTSSSSTTITKSTSTVEFVLAPDYLSSYPYEFDTYDLFGDVKILRNLPADLVRNQTCITLKNILNTKMDMLFNLPWKHKITDEWLCTKTLIVFMNDVNSKLLFSDKWCTEWKILPKFCYAFYIWHWWRKSWSFKYVSRLKYFLYVALERKIW